MSYLNDAQQKHLLMRCEYTLKTNQGLLRGRKVGFARDYRGLGLVVVFHNGTRAFWGVNPHTMQVVDLGIPPPPPRHHRQPSISRQSATLLPRWR